MASQLAIWAVSLTLLGGLVLVVRFKTELCATSPAGYREIAGGLILLSLSSMMRLYWGMGLFVGLPFIGDALFFDILNWIGVITGSLMLVTGVGSWLPLARNHRRYNQAKVRRLDLLRQVGQLVGVESRVDSIFSRVLEQMVEQYQFAHGVVFKYSPSHGELYQVGATSEATISTIDAALVQVDREVLTDWQRGRRTSLASAFVGLPSELPEPSEIIPVLANNRPVGFFLFWGEPTLALDADDRRNLRLAADVIGSKIEFDIATLKMKWETELQTWCHELAEGMADNLRLERRITTLATALGKRMHFDNLSLSIIDSNSKRVRRLTSSTRNLLLIENGQPMPEKSSLTGPAYHIGQRQVFNLIDESNQPLAEEYRGKKQIRSLLAEPIVLDGGISGVLTLVSSNDNAYHSQELRAIQMALPLVRRLVAEQLHTQAMERALTLAETGNRCVEEMGIAPTTAHACGNALQLLADELKPDFVRVATVEDDGAFLRSRALYGDSIDHTVVPGNGRMIMSVMPRHQELLASGCSVTIARGDQPLAEVEARQLFRSDVERIWLMPMKTAGKVSGVLSLGWLAGNEYSSVNVRAEQAMVKIIANGLAMHLSTETAVEKVVERQPLAVGQLAAAVQSAAAVKSTMRGNLRSSLTGIIGSVDLLKMRGRHGSDEEVNRYLSIIDRSARKIMAESLTEEQALPIQ